MPTELRRARFLGCASTFVVVLAVAAATGCEEEKIKKLPEPELQVDVLKQKQAAQVDILWVVDNSGSMVEEQALLASNFNRFITGLTTCQGTGAAGDRCDFASKRCTVSGGACNPPDYHIGVISSDVKSAIDQGKLRRVGLCVPRAGNAPMGGKHRYCAGDNRHCQQDPDNPDPEFDPANGVCDMGQERSRAFITPETPGAQSAFGRAVRVGVGGSGREQGIRAAAMALGRDVERATGAFVAAPPENAGFHRADASLFVIFVSDEEDSSFGQISYYYRLFEGLKKPGNEGLVSFSAIVGDPDQDGDGPMTGGCPAGAALRTAEPGTRYIALAMYSRGLSAELRVCDAGRVTCPADLECKTPVPSFPRAGGELGVCVPKAACRTDDDCGHMKCGDAGCVSCEGGRCVARADRFVELLERNGIFGSICAPDYGRVLGALGFEAAGLRRKFVLTKFPDCAKDVPCGEAKTAPVCVKVASQLIPNDRELGWVWEPTSNAIFFDGSFVPSTDAQIEVTYRVAKADRALACEGLLK